MKTLKTLRFLIVFLVLICMSSCIALVEDVAVAKSQLQAETNAKIKILEESVTESMKREIELLAKRLEEIEKSLQKEKQAQKNKIDLSFTNLEELRETIKELNNRIDGVDVAARQSGVFNEKLAETEKKIEEQGRLLADLKAEILMQIEDLKPVENLTITKDNVVKLPSNEEKSYSQLVNFTKNGGDPLLARRGWELFSQKWPKSRKCDVLYWTAETYFIEKSYNKAIELFFDVEKKFENCIKIESSYIKIAYSLIYTGKIDSATKIIKGVKQKFPKSSFPDKLKELEKMIAQKEPKKKQKSSKKSK